MEFKKVICSKCNNAISSVAITRHERSCTGFWSPIKIKKIRGIDYDPNSGFKNGTRFAWNKGLTKESNSSVMKASQSLSNRYESGELIIKREPYSENMKRVFSEKLKLAHAEGRHPGWAHKNNDPNRRSYPERWFLTAANNDKFLSTCSIIEQYREGKYWIDFAFMNESVAVEIDGAQHELPEAIEKDKIRDEFLYSRGWCMYRIGWSYISEQPQKALYELCEYLKDPHRKPYRKLLKH